MGNQLDLVALVNRSPINRYEQFDIPTFLYLLSHQVPKQKYCIYDLTDYGSPPQMSTDELPIGKNTVFICGSYDIAAQEFAELRL